MFSCWPSHSSAKPASKISLRRFFSKKAINFFLNLFSPCHLWLGLAFSRYFSKIYRYIGYQWIPELRHYAPSVPIVLVGTKLGMEFFSTLQ